MTNKTRSTLIILLVAETILVMIMGLHNPFEQIAYAHFFGAIKDVDGYRVEFQPYPSAPIAGDNKTLLNFSVLNKESNQNLNNIFSSLIIKEKHSGKIVGQVPYKFYEFSDITIPYKFQNIADYTVTLETRINGDLKYEVNPLIVSFDVSALDPNQIMPFDEFVLYVVAPIIILFTICITAYLFMRRNKIKRSNKIAE